MRAKELKRVVDFYKNVILQFIIKPVEINEIFLLVRPNETIMQPYMKKQKAITLYVQSYQQEVLDSLGELFENAVNEIDGVVSLDSKSEPDETSNLKNGEHVTTELQKESQGYYKDGESATTESQKGLNKAGKLDSKLNLASSFATNSQLVAKDSVTTPNVTAKSEAMPVTEQSHKEDFTPKTVLESLEEELLALEDCEDNKNARRILKMRITKTRNKK